MIIKKTTRYANTEWPNIYYCIAVTLTVYALDKLYCTTVTAV
nr:MAG TPA: hypothetical protein [Caudoviricetes sp.]